MEAVPASTPGLSIWERQTGSVQPPTTTPHHNPQQKGTIMPKEKSKPLNQGPLSDNASSLSEPGGS
jgi:hypothetical protein